LLIGCHVAGSVQNQVFAFTIVYGWPSCGSVPDGYREGTGTGITSSPHAARASAIDGGGGGGAAGAPGVAAGGLQNATHAALAGSGGQPNGNAELAPTLPGKNGLVFVEPPPGVDPPVLIGRIVPPPLDPPPSVPPLPGLCTPMLIVLPLPGVTMTGGGGVSVAQAG